MLPDTPRVHSRLDLLYLVTREFNTGHDIIQVLNRVLTATVASVGASDASLSLFSTEGNLDHFIPVTGFQRQQIDQSVIEAIHEHGLVNWIKREQKPVLIEDTSNDERWWYKEQANGDATKTGSAIGVPIVASEKLVGVLTITAAQPHYFDQNDLSMLAIIADQAAFAIANARLFEAEKHRRRLADILASIARTINSTLDLNEVLDLILKHLALVVDYDSSSIMLYDQTDRLLRVRAARGFDDMADALSVTLPEVEGTPNHNVLARKSPIVIGDVDKEPGWVKSSSSRKVHSWIGAPLIARDKVIGLLTVDSHKINRYTAENAKEVAAFADQAATAVANAQSVNLLRYAEASYTALFENSTDVIIITDYRGTILDTNHKACQVLAQHKTGLIGSDISIVSKALKNFLIEKSTRLRASESVSLEIRVIDAEDNIVFLEVHGSQVHYVGADCVQWVGRDISARIEAEKLRQDLVNMLVHDLRGPVGNLINVIEMLPMLVDTTDENDSFQTILEMARRSGQEVRDLIDSMLDVGLLERGEVPLQRNPVILDDMIAAVYEQIEPRASAKEMEVTFYPLPETPVLFLDGSMIRRVLINLVDNAIKYTPNEGIITLTTEFANNVLHFAISDNGPGISRHDQEHIFDKFSRVNHKTKISGVGLGLAFCKLAVEAHGGTIAVQSDGIPGNGSTFHITVPIGTDLVDL
ncbi:MAG: GAF domain-containing protein [Anaerolineae bacterium]|nr:GAF domain-containing protein [Anaerolineae bacterium]